MAGEGEILPPLSPQSVSLMTLHCLVTAFRSALEVLSSGELSPGSIFLTLPHQLPSPIFPEAGIPTALSMFHTLEYPCAHICIPALSFFTSRS